MLPGDMPPTSAWGARTAQNPTIDPASPIASTSVRSGRADPPRRRPSGTNTPAAAGSQPRAAREGAGRAAERPARHRLALGPCGRGSGHGAQLHRNVRGLGDPPALVVE